VASEVEVEIVGTGLDRLGTTNDVFVGALRRRMAGKRSGVGCTLLVSIVGRTQELVVRRIRAAGSSDGEQCAETSVSSASASTSTTRTSSVDLIAFTRETQWRIVPGRSVTTTSGQVALPDREPLSETERQARILLGASFRLSCT
jgi:hypothetical protein